MSFTLSALLGLSGQGSLNLGAAASSRVDQLSLGPANQASFPTPQVAFVNGSGTTLLNGALQGDNWYLNQLTIAGSGSYNLTLNGGSDKDPSGAALAFTAITLVMIAITAINGASYVPDGTDYLKVGPNGVTNAAQLWFGGTGSGQYETVYWQAFHPGPAAGWTVNSTTASLLPIANPGSNSITCAVLVIGH